MCPKLHQQGSSVGSILPALLYLPSFILLPVHPTPTFSSVFIYTMRHRQHQSWFKAPQQWRQSPVWPWHFCLGETVREGRSGRKAGRRQTHFKSRRRFSGSAVAFLHPHLQAALLLPQPALLSFPSPWIARETGSARAGDCSTGARVDKGKESPGDIPPG